MYFCDLPGEDMALHGPRYRGVDHLSQRPGLAPDMQTYRPASTSTPPNSTTRAAQYS